MRCRIKVLLGLCVALLVSGCVSSANWEAAHNQPSSHIIRIPPHSAAFTVPKGWGLGYGGWREPVVFPDRLDSYTYQFGQSAFAKDVGTFYCGVRGDFSDWDMTLTVTVLRFTRPASSAKEVPALLADVFHDSYPLKSGEKLNVWSEPELRQISGVIAISFQSADTLRMGLFERTGPVTVNGLTFEGPSFVSLQPDSRIIFLIDSQFAVMLSLQHWQKDRLTSERFAWGRSFIEQIAKEMLASRS